MAVISLNEHVFYEVVLHSSVILVSVLKEVECTVYKSKEWSLLDRKVVTVEVFPSGGKKSLDLPCRCETVHLSKYSETGVGGCYLVLNLCI